MGLESRDREQMRFTPLLRTVAWLQLPLVLIALGIWTYVASEIGTLVQTRQDLEQRISRLQDEYKVKKEEIQGYQKQLSEAREAVRLVSQAINRYHAHRYDEAIATYDQALNLDPENPYIHNLKGYSLFKAKKYNESVREQDRAIDLKPDFAWAHFDKARVQCAIGQFAEAKHSIQKTLYLDKRMKATMKEDGEFQSLCGKLSQQELGQN